MPAKIYKIQTRPRETREPSFYGGSRMRLRMAVVVALCVSFICCFAGVQGYAQGAGKITVYNPMGTPPPIQMKPMAERLNTLDGKTIYLVNTGFVGTDRLMAVMTEWFAANYPKTTIVNAQAGMTNLPQDVRDEINSKADAVILGLGH